MPNTIKQKTKYSGVEWFGNVPKDWEVKKLKFVFKYFTGGTPDSDKDKYYSDDGLNWITITDLDGKFTSESKNKITELAVKDKNMKIAPTGSLLYSFKLSVGQMAFVSKETYTNEAIFAILPDKDINLDFWYYALQSYLIENANENIYGAKIFNQQLIDNSLLLVPPPFVQKEVGKYLDIKTEEIKKFINDKKKLISLLEEQKKIAIHKALSTPLSAGEKTKSSDIDWLGDIPETWEVKRLKDVCFVNKKNHKDKYADDFLIKYIEIENINNGLITKAPEEVLFSKSPSRARRICEKGDILISTVRTYLKAIAKIDLEDKNLVCSTGFAVLTPNEDVMLGEYLFYSVFNHYFIEKVCSLSDGVSYPAINEPVLSKIKIFLPPLSAQKIILDYLKKETFKIDKAIHTVQQEIELIEEYKKSLIYQAVTGKIKTLLTNK